MKLPHRPGDPDFLLRRALQANVAFSTLCGIVWIVGGESLGRGFGRDGSMAADGIGLLVFASLLAVLAMRPRIPRSLAVVVVALDVLWVLSVAGQIATGTFSAAGNWVMALIALCVLDFAVLQGVGVYRSHRQRLDGAQVVAGA